jgi:hypothetical protein
MVEVTEVGEIVGYVSYSPKTFSSSGNVTPTLGNVSCI